VQRRFALEAPLGSNDFSQGLVGACGLVLVCGSLFRALPSFEAPAPGPISPLLGPGAFCTPLAGSPPATARQVELFEP
jgi:hypothetical protein